MGGVVMKRVLLYVICLLMLASCGGSSSRSTEVNVLCSPQDTWCRGMKAAFEAKFNIKVNYANMSAGEALSRLRTEKDNPQFDIWWGGSIDNYILAKEDGLLAQYDSPNYGNLLESRYKDKDNQWGGIYVGSLAFCTNRDWLAAHPNIKPPQSWDDLLKPEFTGEISMPHPATSGTAYTLVSTILQLKGEREGWAYLNKLGGQVKQFTKSGNSSPILVGKGEAAVCLGFSHAIIEQVKVNNLPLELTFPQEGTGYEIGGMAIIKGAKHEDAAKLWFDWALTAEAQALSLELGAYQAPTVKGIEVALPELLTVKLIEYDFVWSAEHKDKFVKKFTQEIATADNLLR